MNCELNLVPISCDRTGVGYTSHPLSADSNRLHLIKGHAKNFPNISGQQYFYVKIAGCDGCCEVAKVVRIEEDTLHLDRTIGAKCDCIMSNTMVSYEWNNIRVVQDIANAIGINVLSPLKYDPCTRTLSVDCKELFAADCGGCGCGEGATETTGTNTGTPGLRGQKGEQGEKGVGIAELKITNAGQLLYILTDGTTRSAGTLPIPKGAKGEQGEKGEKGEDGPKGDDGAHLSTATVNDEGKGVFTMSDGSNVELDLSPLKGEQGETGEQGPKGDKGDTGHSFQFVEVGAKAYIYGIPNSKVLIKSPQMAGITLGPYTTNADGFVEFDKPAIQGTSLMQLFVDGKLVGISKAG